MLKEGDIVKHKCAFLRNTGWFFDVPKNGLVKAVRPFSDEGQQILVVEWCDGITGNIRSTNVLLDSQLDPS